MCVVSMIMDHYTDKWTPYVKSQPYIGVPRPPEITGEEIDELRELLRRAREYDRKNNQSDCELDEKKRKLKELAEKLGADIKWL